MATKRTFIPLLIVMTLGASLLGSGLAGVALAETPKKTPTAGRQQGAPVKTQLPDGTVIITIPGGDTLTKRPDGTEIITRRDGRSTERRKDGTIITQRPDGTTMTRRPDGTEIITGPDGRSTERRKDGTIIDKRPDGSSKEWRLDGTRIDKRPDGTTIPNEKIGTDSGGRRVFRRRDGPYPDLPDQTPPPDWIQAPIQKSLTPPQRPPGGAVIQQGATTGVGVSSPTLPQPGGATIRTAPTTGMQKVTPAPTALKQAPAAGQPTPASIQVAPLQKAPTPLQAAPGGAVIQRGPATPGLGVTRTPGVTAPGRPAGTLQSPPQQGAQPTKKAPATGVLIGQ